MSNIFKSGPNQYEKERQAMDQRQSEYRAREGMRLTNWQAAAPPPPPVPTMPDQFAAPVLEASRVEQQRIFSRGGRRSTILTGGREDLRGIVGWGTSRRLGAEN